MAAAAASQPLKLADWQKDDWQVPARHLLKVVMAGGPTPATDEWHGDSVTISKLWVLESQYRVRPVYATDLERCVMTCADTDDRGELALHFDAIRSDQPQNLAIAADPHTLIDPPLASLVRRLFQTHVSGTNLDESLVTTKRMSGQFGIVCKYDAVRMRQATVTEYRRRGIRSVYILHAIDSKIEYETVIVDGVHVHESYRRF